MQTLKLYAFQASLQLYTWYVHHIILCLENQTVSSLKAQRPMQYGCKATVTYKHSLERIKVEVHFTEGIQPISSQQICYVLLGSMIILKSFSLHVLYST